MVHTALTFINLSNTRIYIENSTLIKKTKFHEERLSVKDITSIELKDITFENKPGLLKFEDYTYLTKAAPRFKVGLNILTSGGNSILLTEPMIKLPRTIQTIAGLVESNKKIQIGEFTKRLINEGSFDYSQLYDNTEGRTVTFKPSARWFLIATLMILGALILAYLLPRFLNSLIGT